MTDSHCRTLIPNAAIVDWDHGLDLLNVKFDMLHLQPTGKTSESKC